MHSDLSFLLSAAIVFIGSHVFLSHPLRGPAVSLMGERGFLAVYSLVAVVTLGWLVVAFGAAPRGPWLWPAYTDWAWGLASLLTLLALVLLLGSLRGNPALPGADRLAAAREAAGVFTVTRHPMMWGIALWAAAHVLVSPDPRTIVLMGAFILLAIGGSAMQDRKKLRQVGENWAEWEANTHFVPRPAGLMRIGWRLWLGALAVWTVLTWAHLPLGGIAAGIWRWLG